MAEADTNQSSADDYYGLLGIDRGASDDEIKRAYRRRARELHPDHNADPGAEARFKEVTKAYEVLRDPERRQRYDRFGAEGADGNGPMGSPFGAPFGNGLGDLFDAFFGGATGNRRRRSGPVPGPDAEVVLELSFQEAIFGTQREVSVHQLAACESCGASGARPGTTAMRCPDCQGSGELRRVRQSILGQVMTSAPCGRCDGIGEVIASPCPDCQGDGRRPETRTFTVEVPAGVDDGATLLHAGRASAGMRGGPPGDLYVRLLVRPDPRFERDGHDLHAVFHVSVAQAALGANLSVETLDGAEEVAIAPGTQTGTVIRLRARGVPHVRGRGRGDLLLSIFVDTPTELTQSQEDLLRSLAAERGETVTAHTDGFFSRLRSALG